MQRFISTLIFMAVALATQLQAQATLSVQGVLKNSDGSAVEDGNYAITFKLYTQDVGGSPVWEETQGSVSVVGGIYSALLGSENPLTAAFNVPHYLSIAIDGGVELQPRTLLTSAPYALSLIGQDNVFPNTGNVGVGTASPESQLHVAGDILLKREGSSSISFVDLDGGTGPMHIGYIDDGTPALDITGGGVTTDYLRTYTPTPTHVQGNLLGWNRDGGSGRAFFGNNPGIGGGGFEFVNYDQSGTLTNIPLSLTGDGRSGFNVTNPHPNFQIESVGGTTWAGGIFARGGTNGVVLGEHVGIAQIAGHNAAGNAWSDLLINSGGGNVGIGVGTPLERLHVAECLPRW